MEKLVGILFLVFSFGLMTSYGFAKDNDRLVSEGLVQASVNDVWQAFTTKSGIESWMAAHAEIDLRIGGIMKTQYDPNGAVDDSTSIHNTILCFEPLKMLSIQVSKAPEKFPFPKAIKQMWTIIYFESKGENETLVRSVCLGFTEDEESKNMRKFFEHGNAQTIQGLQKRFEKKSNDK